MLPNTPDAAFVKLLSDMLVALLSALIPVLITGIFVWLMRVLESARQLLSHKLTQAQIQTVEHWVRLGVFATEQLMANAENEKKADYCLEWVVTQLAAHNLSYDFGHIADLIEAVVGQEKINLLSVHIPKYDEPSSAMPAAAPAPADPVITDRLASVAAA